MVLSGEAPCCSAVTIEKYLADEPNVNLAASRSSDVLPLPVILLNDVFCPVAMITPVPGLIIAAAALIPYVLFCGTFARNCLSMIAAILGWNVVLIVKPPLFNVASRAVGSLPSDG